MNSQVTTRRSELEKLSGAELRAMLYDKEKELEKLLTKQTSAHAAKL